MAGEQAAEVYSQRSSFELLSAVLREGSLPSDLLDEILLESAPTSRELQIHHKYLETQQKLVEFQKELDSVRDANKHLQTQHDSLRHNFITLHRVAAQALAERDATILKLNTRLNELLKLQQPVQIQAHLADQCCQQSASRIVNVVSTASAAVNDVDSHGAESGSDIDLRANEGIGNENQQCTVVVETVSTDIKMCSTFVPPSMLHGSIDSNIDDTHVDDKIFNTEKDARMVVDEVHLLPEHCSVGVPISRSVEQLVCPGVASDIVSSVTERSHGSDCNTASQTVPTADLLNQNALVDTVEGHRNEMSTERSKIEIRSHYKVNKSTSQTGYQTDQKAKQVKNLTRDNDMKVSKPKDSSEQQVCEGTDHKDEIKQQRKEEIAFKERTEQQEKERTAHRNVIEHELKGTACKDRTTQQMNKEKVHRDGPKPQINEVTAQRNGTEQHVTKGTGRKDGARHQAKEQQIKEEAVCKDRSKQQFKEGTTDRDRSKQPLDEGMTDRDGSKQQFKEGTTDRDRTEQKVKEGTTDRDRSKQQVKEGTTDRDRSKQQVKEGMTDRDRTEQKVKEGTTDRDRSKQPLDEGMTDRDGTKQQFKEGTTGRDRTEQKVKEVITDRDKSKQQFKDRTTGRDRTEQKVKEVTADRDRSKQQVKEGTTDRDRSKQQFKEGTTEKDRSKQQVNEGSAEKEIGRNLSENIRLSQKQQNVALKDANSSIVLEEKRCTVESSAKFSSLKLNEKNSKSQVKSVTFDAGVAYSIPDPPDVECVYAKFNVKDCSVTLDDEYCNSEGEDESVNLSKASKNAVPKFGKTKKEGDVVNLRKHIKSEVKSVTNNSTVDVGTSDRNENAKSEDHLRTIRLLTGLDTVSLKKDNAKDVTESAEECSISGVRDVAAHLVDERRDSVSSNVTDRPVKLETETTKSDIVNGNKHVEGEVLVSPIVCGPTVAQEIGKCNVGSLKRKCEADEPASKRLKRDAVNSDIDLSKLKSLPQESMSNGKSVMSDTERVLCYQQMGKIREAEEHRNFGELERSRRRASSVNVPKHLCADRSENSFTESEKSSLPTTVKTPQNHVNKGVITPSVFTLRFLEKEEKLKKMKANQQNIQTETVKGSEDCYAQPWSGSVVSHSDTVTEMKGLMSTDSAHNGSESVTLSALPAFVTDSTDISRTERLSTVDHHLISMQTSVEPCHKYDVETVESHADRTVSECDSSQVLTSSTPGLCCESQQGSSYWVTLSSSATNASSSRTLKTDNTESSCLMETDDISPRLDNSRKPQSVMSAKDEEKWRKAFLSNDDAKPKKSSSFSAKKTLPTLVASSTCEKLSSTSTNTTPTTGAHNTSVKRRVVPVLLSELSPQNSGMGSLFSDVGVINARKCVQNLEPSRSTDMKQGSSNLQSVASSSDILSTNSVCCTSTEALFTSPLCTSYQKSGKLSCGTRVTEVIGKCKSVSATKRDSEDYGGVTDDPDEHEGNDRKCSDFLSVSNRVISAEVCSSPTSSCHHQSPEKSLHHNQSVAESIGGVDLFDVAIAGTPAIQIVDDVTADSDMLLSPLYSRNFASGSEVVFDVQPAELVDTQSVSRTWQRTRTSDTNFTDDFCSSCSLCIQNAANGRQSELAGTQVSSSTPCSHHEPSNDILSAPLQPFKMFRHSSEADSSCSNLSPDSHLGESVDNFNSTTAAHSDDVSGCMENEQPNISDAVDDRKSAVNECPKLADSKPLNQNGSSLHCDYIEAEPFVLVADECNTINRLFGELSDSDNEDCNRQQSCDVPLASGTGRGTCEVEDGEITDSDAEALLKVPDNRKTADDKENIGSVRRKNLIEEKQSLGLSDRRHQRGKLAEQEHRLSGSSIHDDRRHSEEARSSRRNSGHESDRRAKSRSRRRSVDEHSADNRSHGRLSPSHLDMPRNKRTSDRRRVESHVTQPSRRRAPFSFLRKRRR